LQDADATKLELNFGIKKESLGWLEKNPQTDACLIYIGITRKFHCIYS
jgi:hypothetical protein